MLSFMQEEQVSSPPVRSDEYCQKPKTHDAIRDTHDEYLTVATQERQVRKSTYLLAVLFGIGLLCLWFMIKKSTPQTADGARLAGVSAEETQIEIAIAQLTGVRSEMFSGVERMVKKFYEFSDVQQVKVNELVKNPFKLETFLVGAKENPDTKKTDSLIDTYAMAQQQLRQQAKSLKLLTICQSDQGNCCMIDDRILYEGDIIKGFKVSQISDSFVKLESGHGARDPGHEIILKLSE